MITTCYASIREEDYEAFRGILDKYIPDTFQGFSERLSQRMSNDSAVGRLAITEKVYPEEFTIYLRNTGVNPNFEVLDGFANWKVDKKRESST